MNIIYNKVIGTQEEKPLEIDVLSSKTVVYLRKNIERVTIHDEYTQEDYQVWQYDEAKLSSREYTEYLTDKLSEVTPYTETKTAYYLEKEKTFYDVPNGNLTVYFDNYNGSYSVSRIANRVTVSFDTLTESTNITISII